jgi:hypothetical protein
MKKLDIKITQSGGGLLHDSRQDVRTLGKVVNILIEKINDLIDEVNTLKHNNDEKRTGE